MKRNIFKYLVFVITLATTITSCRKDEFVGDNDLGDKGQTILKFAEGPTKTFLFEAFTNIKPISAFSLVRDVNSNESLSTASSVELVKAAVPAAVQAVVEEEEPSRSGPEFHFVKTTPNRGHCVIRQSESKWYSSATEPSAAKAETNGSEAAEVNLKYWLPKIEKYAQLAWDLELKNYEEARKKGL